MGSYLADEDQRLPEFCLTNGTDVSCLTALLAGSADSVGLVGRGGKRSQCQRVWRLSALWPNTYTDTGFGPQIPCMAWERHQCCVTMWGEGRFGQQQTEERESGALCSLLCFPLELTPAFSACTCGAVIMKFNELNRELKGLIQHHLQRCLDSGRDYCYKLDNRGKKNSSSTLGLPTCLFKYVESKMLLLLW